VAGRQRRLERIELRVPDLRLTAPEYIDAIEDPGRRAEIEALDQLIREEAPELERHVRSKMLAYGTYKYRYASGREGEAGVISLASQKRYISLYVSCVEDGVYLAERFAPRLPGADIGRSCVRFTKLDKVDEDVLRELVGEAAQRFRQNPDFGIAR
jgi:uncharacterized protein YdhG (YjbR/CyaY superfamily)